MSNAMYRCGCHDKHNQFMVEYNPGISYTAVRHGGPHKQLTKHTMTLLVG